MLSMKKKKRSLVLKITLIILALIALPYFGYVAWALGSSVFHQIKWEIRGSSNYEIKSDLNDFSPITGVSIITVKDDKIEKVVVIEAQYPEDKHDLQDYEELTINGMFQKAFACVAEFPRFICSFEYDPHYGFPTRVNVDCPNDNICYEGWETIDVIYVKIFEK